METLTVTPAYGRDYKSGKAAKQAWREGKDFIIANIMHKYDGKPMNKQDADQSQTTVMIRYKGLTQLTIVKPAKVKS